MGEVADGVCGDAGLALRVLERVRLDLVPIGIEIEGRPFDELGVGQSRVDDFTPDGIRQRDVAADIKAEPDVGPLGRTGAARVDGIEPGAVPDAAQEVMEEDRMRLPGIAAPEDDQVRLLDLTI